MDEQIQIADLVKQISSEVNFERGAVCAVDCLMQWNAGQLYDTLIAWRSYLDNFKNKKPHEETPRYGAWVPAIAYRVD